jgi:hypothetical protein
MVVVPSGRFSRRYHHQAGAGTIQILEVFLTAFWWWRLHSHRGESILI